MMEKKKKKRERKKKKKRKKNHSPQHGPVGEVSSPESFHDEANTNILLLDNQEKKIKTNKEHRHHKPKDHDKESIVLDNQSYNTQSPPKLQTFSPHQQIVSHVGATPLQYSLPQQHPVTYSQSQHSLFTTHSYPQQIPSHNSQTQLYSNNANNNSAILIPDTNSYSGNAKQASRSYEHRYARPNTKQ